VHPRDLQDDLLRFAAHPVADRLDRPLEVLKARLVVVELDGGFLGGEVDARGLDPGKSLQGSLNGLRARGAMHTLDLHDLGSCRLLAQQFTFQRSIFHGAYNSTISPAVEPPRTQGQTGRATNN